MSQNNNRGSRVVFVGNIPFELSEEQLIEVFKEVGPVTSFRLLFDNETGRPKGYGFCEFVDAETAASAVRNLNDYEIGGRQLRVDYATMNDNSRQNNRNNQNRHGHNNQQHHNQHHNQQHHSNQHQNQQPQNQPHQQPKTSAEASSIEEISKVLGSMNAQDLYTLMTQMKQMSTERTDFTKEFLTTNPQVAYSLFQAMVMMNLVDPNLIYHYMTKNKQANAAATPQVRQQVTPPQPPAPVVNSPVPPSVEPQQQPNLDTPNDAAEQQKALLMQVLQLSDEQIEALPPQHRDQIRQLVKH
ncbi:hypothetical protein K501DRAFT_175147 [Backusella circina FSU 941]|nr:hypothetical protein K501DRAFT_175147 [Backusella circina FSU 941]